MLEEAFREDAHSPYLPAIMVMYDQGGVEALSPEDRRRFWCWHMAKLARLDHLHFQYEQGYLDEDQHHYAMERPVKTYVPRWKELDIWPRRGAFRKEVERIVCFHFRRHRCLILLAARTLGMRDADNQSL